MGFARGLLLKSIQPDSVLGKSFLGSLVFDALNKLHFSHGARDFHFLNGMMECQRANRTQNQTGTSLDPAQVFNIILELKLLLNNQFD